MKIEKDRAVTEKRLIEAVGSLIEENGLEFLGVNQVSQRAGVSKMLIYRYFGSMEELIAAYIIQRDYWINVPLQYPGKENLPVFIKNLFREQIRQLKEDKLLIRLYRWELSVNNPVVEQIRRRREENGLKLIEFVSQASGRPYKEVQIMATFISASITYLAMFGDTGHVYNGLRVGEENGWTQVEEGLNLLIDRWME